MKYYKLPLNFRQLTKGRIHPKSRNITEAIQQWIHLLMTTYCGEYFYDETLGCRVWDYDFQNNASERNDTLQMTNRGIEKSFTATLLKHENRLQNIVVKATMKNLEFAMSANNKGIIAVKKKLNILITGQIVETNDDFEYSEELYFSPIAVSGE